MSDCVDEKTSTESTMLKDLRYLMDNCKPIPTDYEMTIEQCANCFTYTCNNVSQCPFCEDCFFCKDCVAHMSNLK